ncbi:MAG: response regulator transcription factor [Bacteroidales bacterium]|nr:response regulator transcription factor [Bacteroidales bacterium]
MIKIAIADDNLFALKAIEEKLSVNEDIFITHIAQNGLELLKLLTKNSEIDLILMDIEMPVLNGIETTENIKQQFPDIKIVMITIYDDDEYIFNAIKAGADSYILKETKADKIYETIIDTLNGGSVMSPSIALKTLQLLKTTTYSIPKKDIEKITLSKRETEILEQLSNGFTNKRIAENLFISPFTVKRHIENIYQKLQARNRIEMLDKARKNGLI